MQIVIPNIESINIAAGDFINATKELGTCFAFDAPMGAGKTTFIKAICEELGVKDVITSPTFAIINEYSDKDSKPIYHFDFYRIKKLEELYDMGADEYFYSGNLCFMEWAEYIESALPENIVRVTIKPQADGSRLITF